MKKRLHTCTAIKYIYFHMSPSSPHRLKRDGKLLEGHEQIGCHRRIARIQGREICAVMIIATRRIRRHHYPSDHIIEKLDIAIEFAVAQIQPVAETAKKYRRYPAKEKTRQKYHLPVSVEHRLLEPIQVTVQL